MSAALPAIPEPAAWNVAEPRDTLLVQAAQRLGITPLNVVMLVQELKELERPSTAELTVADEHFTELGLARQFILRHGGNLRYCAAWGKWLCWDGCRWCRDEIELAARWIKDTVLHFYQKHAYLKKIGNDETAAQLFKFAVRCEAASVQAGALKLARSEKEIALASKQLDTHRWLLNVSNGTIDLHDGRLREHRREDMLTAMASCEFNPAAKAPRWEQFLQEVTAGDAGLTQYLQKMAGVCLTGDVSEQVLFIVHGDGGNGKSVFLETLAGMMGPDYAGQAPPDLLMTRSSIQHPTEMAFLEGKRMVLASETEAGCRLRLQCVKRLTGDATITARRMREDFYVFDRTHKMILQTNHRPALPETGEAVRRRIRLVPFNVTIPREEQDKRLVDTLRQEWPGILSWAVQGCLAWQKEGLAEPQAVLAATAGYLRDESAGRKFLAECTTDDPGAWVECKALHQAYITWCDRRGVSSCTPGQFYAELRNLGFEDKSHRFGGAVKRGFPGLQLAGSGGATADDCSAVAPCSAES